MGVGAHKRPNSMLICWF